MDYQVKSGDCLWNIVQQKFGLNDADEISSKVNQIAKANNLESADLIFDGQKINLGEDVELSSGDSIDIEAWTKEGVEKDGEVGEFKMFEFNKETYDKDLKEFAQKNVIDKYDKDKDGKLNLEEYIALETGDSKEVKEVDKTKLQKAFDKMSLDDDKEFLSSEEIASHLMKADYKNKDGKAELDGKFTFSDYVDAFKANSDNEVAQKFYDEFYKEA